MSLQPDQRPELWDDHVTLYEAVFEPLTLAFAEAAIDTLTITPGDRVIDVGAGSGGAALELAKRGAQVLAIDASQAMVDRIRVRTAAMTGGAIDAEVMDGTRLYVPDASMDAALSVFGVVLFSDAVAGVAEVLRVLKPQGRAALVTWTEPEHYELVGELLAAVKSIIPDFPPPPSLPAQLRYKEEADFRALMATGGLVDIAIERVTRTLQVPSAGWLVDRVIFAPGMAAMMAGLQTQKEAVLAAFKTRLESRHGPGPISLKAVAFIGSGRKKLHRSARWHERSRVTRP